jgi:PAS domain S-box-containing protein
VKSLRSKLALVIFATTGIALLTMGAALLERYLSEYRRDLEQDVTTAADIIAQLSAPALDFADQKGAERSISALGAKSSVRNAALYLADGSLFASYSRDGTASPARAPMPVEGATRTATRMEVTRSISQEGELLGTIFVSADYDVRTHVYGHLWIIVLMTLLAMAVALAFSVALGRSITGPVAQLAAVADAIVARRDHSLRAPATPLEEFSVVMHAFNSILDESDARTRELKDSHRALRRSESMYRAIGETINYGVWVCDATGRNTYASDSFLKLVGITQAQCSGMGWSDILHPDDVEGTVAAWEACVRTGDAWYREHRFLCTDGNYHPILAQGVAIRDDDGRITGWAGINLDISRLKETEDSLREADRRKDDFLATLAHELRNPLAPIRHAAKLLSINGLDPGQAQTAREIITRQVGRMALLLDDLLEVSRITRGRLELRIERVSLNAVVKAAVETSRPLFEAKKHFFTIRLPGKPLELQVDPLRISQALSNLLTNAAKYTDPGGRIELDVSQTPETLAISVSDSGIGVPAAALPTIFEMFSQVDSAIDRAEGGLGIGLALVKGLVGMHGGTVKAASAGLGKGSTFTICIPGTAVHETPVAAPAAAAEPGAAGPRGRIMVVDDNRDAASSLAMVLRSSGHTVMTAYSGEEALELLEREKPDAIVLDIGMPQMNGYEVARRIRQSGAGQSVLLVALTGWGQKEDVRQAIDAGFNHHMTKPADPENIERVLRTFLNSDRVCGAAKENPHQRIA